MQLTVLVHNGKTYLFTTTAEERKKIFSTKNLDVSKLTPQEKTTEILPADTILIIR